MKNIGRIVLPIIILLLTVRINAVPVKAFDMIVRNLPNSEQLPTKELLCIFQDSEGYMWYGTEGGGLCRDDGYTVKVFRSDFKNPGILENVSIRPRACFFPLFSFLPLWLHYNLNPLCVQY